MKTTRKLAAAAMAGALLAGACASESTEPTVSGPADPVPSVAGEPVGLFASSLVEFDSCEVLLAHLRAEALERVGAYGFDVSFPMMAIPESAEMGDHSIMGDAAASESAPTAGADYSTTNVQEIGVDEPDAVKTDGRRILAMASRVLYYVDVSAGSPELVSTLPLERWRERELWDHQIFMSADTALVMAAGYDSADSERPGVVTIVLRIDLSEPSRPRVTSTLVIEGGFVSARLVGDRAALVVRSQPRVTAEFVYPSSSSRSAELRAERINRQTIEESTLDQWAPRFELTDGAGGGTTDGTLTDCSSSFAPREFSGFDFLSVLTFDVGQDIDAGAVATVVSGGDTVYASTERLYVAAHRWIDRNDTGDEDISGISTHIHRFAIGGPDGPVYEASGAVDGFLLNQFAMSEHDGFLRVASTDQPPWWWREGTSESRVDVLERDGRELRVIGSVGGLGRDERIFAVRFMGDIGYVVTFRQTDPLYTIDLSDPTAPRVLGELKILGYSAYLHPIGDGLLLGVGQDADEQGRIGGTQVSIFDVSDLADPVRIHQFTFPESSMSDVEFDHRAFLYWPPTGMAVLPVGWWTYDEESDQWDTYSGAVALDVGRDGIRERGRIDHEPEPMEGAEVPVGWATFAPITRSLVIRDTLFTLSAAGLEGSDLESLSETSWIPFPYQVREEIVY